MTNTGQFDLNTPKKTRDRQKVCLRLFVSQQFLCLQISPDELNAKLVLTLDGFFGLTARLSMQNDFFQLRLGGSREPLNFSRRD